MYVFSDVHLYNQMLSNKNRFICYNNIIINFAYSLIHSPSMQCLSVKTLNKKLHINILDFNLVQIYLNISSQSQASFEGLYPPS